MDAGGGGRQVALTLLVLYNSAVHALRYFGARQMTASYDVQTCPNLLIASEGASTDAVQSCWSSAAENATGSREMFDQPKPPIARSKGATS